MERWSAKLSLTLPPLFAELMTTVYQHLQTSVFEDIAY